MCVLRKTIFFCISLFASGISLFAGSPALLVDGSDKADFGRYPAREAKEFVFRFSNKGEKVVNLIGVRTTCGCAFNELGAKKLEPGESSFVKTVVAANGIFGPYSKNVYVETDDPAQKFLSFGIAGDAVPIATLKPQDKLSAGRIPAGAPWTQEFLVEASEDGVELGDAQTGGTIAAELSVKRTGKRTHSLLLTLKPEAGASGDFACKVSIPVKEPQGWQPLQIIVSGQAGISLMLVPGQLIVSSEATEPVSRTLELKAPGSKSLTPEMIICEKPEGVEVDIKPKSEGVLSMTVTIPIELITKLKSAQEPKLLVKVPNAAPVSVPIKVR